MENTQVVSSDQCSKSVYLMSHHGLIENVLQWEAKGPLILMNYIGRCVTLPAFVDVHWHLHTAIASGLHARVSKMGGSLEDLG